MRELTLFIGTYTRPLPHVDGHGEGIYRCRLDVTTGALACDGVVARLDNPTFLALDPAGRRLYAVSETDETDGAAGGALHAFAIGDAGLIPLNWQFTGGAAPCHLVVDPAGRCVLTANYNGGSVSVLPIGEDGRVGPLAQLVQHIGVGPHPIRQTTPHPHGVTFDLAGRYLFVPDLGTDRVHVYCFADRRRRRLKPADSAGVRLLQRAVADATLAGLDRLPPDESLGFNPQQAAWATIHPGAGPRHLAFHPNGRWVYCINELDVTVSALAFVPETGRLEERGWVSLLPHGHSEGRSPKNLASGAEIALDPAGRFVYASLRGYDSIAILAVAPDGGLTLLGHEPTQGRTPRHFALTLDGRLLVAANQDSDSLVTFRVDPETGGLTPTGHATRIPSPACVLTQ